MLVAACGTTISFGTDVPNYPPYCFIENDRTVGLPTEPNRPEFNRPGPMLPGWQWVDILPELTRRAVKYVEDAAKQPQRRPFFLYFPLTAPHYLIVPAAEFSNAVAWTSFSSRFVMANSSSRPIPGYE